ncbi:hypothetical protein MD484_g5980, partial [Candolleomyces efflorescens]
MQFKALVSVALASVAVALPADLPLPLPLPIELPGLPIELPGLPLPSLPLPELPLPSLPALPLPSLPALPLPELPGLPLPGNPASECTTGPIQCCNSLQTAGTPGLDVILGLLGVVLGDINLPVGVTCSPISVIGVPGNSCSGQVVCCKDNTFNGIISIGCTPVNINL